MHGETLTFGHSVARTHLKRKLITQPNPHKKTLKISHVPHLFTSNANTFEM